MTPFRQATRGILIVALGWLVSWAGPLRAQPAATASANEVRIVAIEGSAEIFVGGNRRGVITQTTNQVLAAGDRLGVLTNSRVRLLLGGRSVVTLGAGSVVEVPPPDDSQPGLNLFKGLMSFFHRDRPGRIRVITPGATAGVKGTEFVVAVETVNNVETTTFSLIDGIVELTNPQGALTLTNGQRAVAEPGQRPRPVAGFVANNVLQWSLYYPAVLDLRDLSLAAAEQGALKDSLVAYQSGDLHAALTAYPAGRTPASDAERIYLAALRLSFGDVEGAEKVLATVTELSAQIPRLANALRQLIAAMKLQPNPATLSPQLPTEFLAASYYEQSRANGDDSLFSALSLARRAATNSPAFSFALVRVAELEFSFGRTREAEEALDIGLALAPRNAQALSLKGFLLAARNKTHDASVWFDRAIEADPALGNAWLGRGLCKIHHTPSYFSISTSAARNALQSANDDLLVAAALEPQRSLFRSYLGKAFGASGDAKHALHELDLAQRLDPNDPTPWLYSALEKWQQNRVNEAIDDLERSIELNDNRALFRSRLKLDQDEATRSAGLAKIYQNAGLDDVSLREAATAVSHDYANASAHQFMAESFDALRDPTRFNLRHETVWFNELLLANMFAPPGAGLLSQHLSQQEYTSLFDRERLGFLTTTEYRSDGQIREIASQSGSFGGTSWALDLDYQHNDGYRPNNELDRLEWYTTLKQQLTPRDSLMLITKYQDYHSGDNRQLYDPATLAPDFTYDEDQKPLLYAGYRHEWSPGVHTLFAAGRLENDQRVTDRNVTAFLYTTNGAGRINPADVNTPFGLTNFSYRSQFETFPVELNQILQDEKQILNLGARFQAGTFDTHNQLDGVNGDPGTVALFRQPPADDSFEEDFRRLSLYAYYTRELWDRFRLTAGVAYDDMKYPSNYRFAPITPGTTHQSRWLPKVALNWTPSSAVQVRGIYAQSVSGVTFDESFRLEPTQLAGFSQAWRTLISESEVGSVAGARYDIYGAALDFKLKPRTYASLGGQFLQQQVDQDLGVFYFSGDPGGTSPQILPGPLSEKLRYEEISATAALHQLLGDQWSLGARYRFTDSTLKTSYPEVPDGLPTPRGDPRQHAALHQVELSALWTHPSGFFARAEAQWYRQHNDGYTPDRPGDDFAQVNLYAGYRLPRLRGAITLGVLNVGGDDYQLNSLNPYHELPHERVFLARLRLNF